MFLLFFSNFYEEERLERHMNKRDLKKEKNETARKRHEDSIKYMYFSRYLLIRYVITIFLFSNLLWLIISASYHSREAIILALVMLIYSAVAAIEQLSKMHNRKQDVPISRIYLYVQAILNILLIIVIFTPFAKIIFPFVVNHNVSYFMIGLLLVGIVLCLICEYRINQIRENKDRYYKAIQVFRKHQP